LYLIIDNSKEKWSMINYQTQIQGLELILIKTKLPIAIFSTIFKNTNS